MRSPRLPAAAAAACLAFAAPAAARAATTPVDPGPSGATGPACVVPPAGQPAPPCPPPAPVKARLKVTAERVGPQRAVLAGARWRVRGQLVPYVAGQTVTVRFVRGDRKLRVKRVVVQPSRTGRSGSFALAFATATPGRVRVRASHLGTAGLAQVVARPVAVDVLPLRAGPGSTGLAVRVLQQRLARLGYVVGRRGSFDPRTGRAVQAFRKATGLARVVTADRAVFRRLARGEGAFRVRYPSHGRHVEADLSHQVLALVGAGGRVERIYPTSSGKPSTPTVLGSFRFYRKDHGTNAKGMVDASYFIRGYAVHGYAEVPVYSASHGCLRVPVPDARSISNWIRVGERIDVYP